MTDRVGFRLGIATTTIMNVLLAALGVGTGLLAARILGPHGRGELAAVQLWPSILATLAMLGMPEALVYVVAKRRDAAGSYWVTATAIALAASAAFAAVGWFLLPLLLDERGQATVEAARWYLAIVPLYALLGLPLEALRGKGDFVVWNAMRLPPVLAWVVVLLLVTPGGDLVRAIALDLLIALGVVVTPVTIVVCALRMRGPFRFDRASVRPLLSYGLPAFAGGAPRTLNLRLDQMLLAAFFPARLLGLYVAAVAWSGAIQPLLNAIGSIAFPSVASESDEAERALRIERTLRLGVTVALILGIAIAGATPLFLPILFGPGFADAVPAALALVIASCVLGVNQILQDIVRGLGAPRLVFRSEIAGMFATALAVAALLPPLDIVGAAVASALGYVVITIVLIRWVSREIDRPVAALLRPDVGQLVRSVRGFKARREMPEVSPPAEKMEIDRG